MVFSSISTLDQTAILLNMRKNNLKSYISNLPEIEIDDSLHIGTGRDRVCYLLPQNKNICIKISKSSNKQTRREVSYYKFLMTKRHDHSSISQYYGKIKTTKGRGDCFEVIRNYDDSMSMTLREAIRNNSVSIEQLNPLLKKLKNNLITNEIVARDLSPANIMLQITSKNDYQLKIIDGLGNPGLNPLTIRTKCLIKRSINKAWASLTNKLTNEFQKVEARKN